MGHAIVTPEQYEFINNYIPIKLRNGNRIIETRDTHLSYLPGPMFHYLFCHFHEYYGLSKGNPLVEELWQDLTKDLDIR